MPLTRVLFVSLLIASSCSGQEQTDDSAFILATGRRLPYLYTISLDQALDPGNNNTANAIISRNLVAQPHLDGRLLGDPANLVLSEDGATLYVINHHGSVDNARFRQHGGRGQIAVIDVEAALNPANDGTARALLRLMDSGGFGAIGTVLTTELLIVNNAENNLTEDGGNRIGFIDRNTGSLRNTVELALGTPGFNCEDYPVPYAAPYGPPVDRPILAPNIRFGCFPNPNGLAMGRTSAGKRLLFTANGGTHDVSVIDLERALAGEVDVEINRIPDQFGAWGMTSTSDGRYVVVAHGGSQRESMAGNAIAILDVDRAQDDATSVEVARVRVGTDDASLATHPLIPAITADNRRIIVPNLRADNVSVVDLERALTGDNEAEIARIPLQHPGGGPVRPKAASITRDGRYAIVSAGPGSLPYSNPTGLLYVIDLETYSVVSTVTGVGNDPYNLTLVYPGDRL